MSPADSKQPRPPRQPPRHPSIEVLLVEDEPSNQKVVTRMLEKLGCRVTLARDGSEGIRLAKEEVFDIVFMDIKMPLVDGITATRAIFAHFDDKPPFRVYALTANVTEETRQQCLEIGMSGFLLKPVRLEELAKCLETTPG